MICGFVRVCMCVCGGGGSGYKEFLARPNIEQDCLISTRDRSNLFVLNMAGVDISNWMLLCIWFVLST